MEIAVVSDLIFPVIGGAERRIVEIYKRLAKKHQVTFYTTKNTQAQESDFFSMKNEHGEEKVSGNCLSSQTNIEVKYLTRQGEQLYRSNGQRKIKG
ncbi:MAG: hypothetical protein ACTSYA_11890, partial [Candidatus Kariarchaeaceae archaeon]